RMKGFASYRRGDRECTTIDLRAGRRGNQGLHVADCAAGLAEQIGPSLCRGRIGEFQISRGRLPCPEEAGEVVYVGQSVRPGLVVWLGHDVAKLGYIVRKRFS